MGKKFLNVNWRLIDGAVKHKRVLRLRANEDGNFMCPVDNCMHLGFRSCRGLRRHIDIRHSWLYWFEKEPVVKREQLVADPSKVKCKALTHNVPSFSVTEGVGADFHRWLRAPLGGGKSNREATQSAKRAMKFLLHVMGDDCVENSLASIEFIDCAVGSASTITKFMETITMQWQMSSSGALNYLKSISDLVDFRKSQGCPDDVLRAFTVTEVYLRRGKDNLRKKKAVEYSRNLDLESLIMKDSWCDLEDMDKVIPFHAKRFKDVHDKCKDPAASPSTTDLAFATRFLATYLFIHVKCSRPRTFQFLTVPMVAKSKTNGGFVDQTEFKTASTYVFDTLVMDEDTLNVIDMYTSTIRPRMTPQCDYVLVSTTGRQYTSFSVAMTLLVKEAIGKYVHPTRFRQIVETSSSERLSTSEQEAVSADQKHRSNVARISYKKKLSRDVAVQGRECMKKMLGSRRDESTAKIASILISSNESEESVELTDVLSDVVSSIDSIDQAVIRKTKELLSPAALLAPSTILGVATNVGTTSSPFTPVGVATNVSTASSSSTIVGVATNVCTTSRESDDVECTAEVSGTGIYPMVKLDDVSDLVTWPSNTQPIVDVKIEEATPPSSRTRKQTTKFLPAEDRALVAGVKKHGFGNWGKIIDDPTYQFQKGRDRNSLRCRYKSAEITRILAKDINGTI